VAQQVVAQDVDALDFGDALAICAIHVHPPMLQDEPNVLAKPI
jgi:hypothetical protein